MHVIKSFGRQPIKRPVILLQQQIIGHGMHVVKSFGRQSINLPVILLQQLRPLLDMVCM